MNLAKLKALLARPEIILLLIIVAQIILFHEIGKNFLARSNLTNLLRFNIEVGMLALVMTPIILTGGIDLSIGSLLGLCAVVFGLALKEYHLSAWAAGTLAIVVGGLGGGFNALLITKLKLPPLIVTLGTFSLYRGLAEAITQGSISYTAFPAEFLAVGNSTVAGLPAQMWIFLSVALLVWLLVHRSTFGRSIRAIGYAPAGATYAGIPVGRRVALAYTLAGTVAGLAAVIFAARLGEARANAGIGFELLAITAVVLGGTSIFGGSGNVCGTLLGWLALAVLTNGLSRIPSISGISRELSGLLTGLLLISALAAHSWFKRRA